MEFVVVLEPHYLVAKVILNRGTVIKKNNPNFND